MRGSDVPVAVQNPARSTLVNVCHIDHGIVLVCAQTLSALISAIKLGNKGVYKNSPLSIIICAYVSLSKESMRRTFSSMIWIL